MKNLFKSKLFLRQYFYIVFIVCIVFVIVSYTFILAVTTSLRNQQFNIAEDYRQEVSRTIERWIEGREYSIKTQALYMGGLAEEDFSSDKLRRYLSEQINWDDNFLNIIVLNEKGEMVNSVEGPNTDINLSDTLFFQNTMKGMRTVTDFLKNTKTGGFVMAIMEPVFINGSPKYAVAGIIEIERVKQIIESMKFGDINCIYLVNEEGVFISNCEVINQHNGNVYQKERGIYKSNTLAVQKVLLKEGGTDVYEDFEGETVIGSYGWLDIINTGLILEFKESKILEPIDDIIKIISIPAAVAIMVGLFLAYFVSRKILNPIDKIVNAVSKIEQNNYNEPLKLKINSEIDILIRQFNNMLEYIKKKDEQLRENNNKLKVQIEDAVEVNKLKSQFLSNISHELRTPLNSIIGFTNRVLKKSGENLPEGQKENLEIVKSEAYHLLELINNLLDFSEIEGGNMEIHIEEFNLLCVVEEAWDTTRMLIGDKKIKYEEEFFNSENIPLISDRLKVKQVLTNIISNAFKYSEEGTVKFSITKEGSFYKIDVKDEGIGIAAEDYENIFDEFRQVDGSLTRKVGGAGLGLSITKRFVELLGGTIRVKSMLGKGSCFTVYLPMEYNNRDRNAED